MEEFENYEDIIEQEREKNSLLRSALNTKWDNANRRFVKYTEKTSDLGRKLVFSILGTIWFIIYNKTDGVIFPSCWFAHSLVFSVVYLFVDYGHYFVGSIVNHVIRNNINECDMNNNSDMDKVLKKEYNVAVLNYIFYTKGVLLATSVVCFIIGFNKL